jgi:asparagine synthase (glutamine-hydrolysing)
MKLASSKVKVVLDGQGGDELLAGYEPYYLTFILDLWRKKKIGTLVRELLQSLDTTGQYIKQYIFSSYQKRLKGIVELLDSRFASEFLLTEMSASGREDLSGLLHQEMTKTSLPRLLRYEDKNSMAFSVEARVPFLDHRLVEYVFSLPANQRLRDGWTKYILRNALKGILPEKIRTRRRKIGFAVPEAAWLRELGNEIRGVFASQKFGNRKYFNQEEILKGFNEFCQGKSDLDASIFWHILNLEMWLRVFIDQ